MSSDEPSFLCFYKPAKNQTVSRDFSEFMAKKRTRGHPSHT